MNDIIKDTLISYTGRMNRIKTNAPSQYSDRQHQYYGDVTRLFAEEYDRYSSDYVEAWVQGLEEEPFEYTKVHIRLSDAITGTSAISTIYDNYKIIEIAERQYSYIRRGAKVITMGNTWLAINPDNMSGITGQTVIERCDNTWNYLDYYGNVQYEPVCVDRLDMRGVDPDSQRTTMINTGYYAIKCQDNEQTRQLGNNSRLYVGNVCFRIAGYAEISREFTYEKDSINMMVFRAMVEEPNMAIDDLEEYVAGGKTFEWNVSVGGQSGIMVGETIQLTASSVRTSEEHTAVVVPSEAHPVSYIWTSSDDGILSVASDGSVTGISEGSAIITCSLAQNPSHSVDFAMQVQGDMTAPHLAFIETVPQKLGLYQTATIKVKYYVNGSPSAEAYFDWSFTGADEDSYSVTYEDMDTAVVKCWSGSIEPLHVTVSFEDASISTDIELEGI